MKKIMKALGKVTLDALYVVSTFFLIMSLFELLSPAAGIDIAKFREIPWTNMFSPYFIIGICLMLHQYCANKYGISYILPCTCGGHWKTIKSIIWQRRQRGIRLFIQGSQRLSASATGCRFTYWLR